MRLLDPRYFLLAAMTVVLTAPTCSSSDDDPPTSPGMPGPVTHLEITASEDGSMIQLWWHEPVLGDPHDGYLVQLSTSSGRAAALDTIIAPPYVHDPGGEFGVYRVWAYNDAGRSEESEVSFYRPMKRMGIELHDIHSPQSGDRSGLGIFDPDYFGDDLDMSNSFFLERTDLYMSNQSSDSTSEPFYFKSPNLSQSPPDNDVADEMDEELPLNVCSDLGTEAPDLIPEDIIYYGLEEVVVGHYYSVRTWEDYYAVIHVEEIDPQDNGRVAITLWASRLQSSRIFYPD